MDEPDGERETNVVGGGVGGPHDDNVEVEYVGEGVEVEQFSSSVSAKRTVLR